MTTIKYIKENLQISEFVFIFGILVTRNRKTFAVSFQSKKYFTHSNVQFIPTNIKVLNSGIKQTETMTREINLAIRRISVNYISLYEGTSLNIKL